MARARRPTARAYGPLREAVYSLVPWKWEVCVVTGGDAETFARYVQTLGITGLTTGIESSGHAYVEAGFPAVIWVQDRHNLPSFVHEAMHVVSGCLEYRGVKPTRDSEEAYTYAVEALVAWYLRPRRWTRPRV